MTSHNIACKIKKHRELKNYTQEYLAQRLNISQNAYSKIETGSVKLTIDRLISICSVLELPVIEMFTCDENLFPSNDSKFEKLNKHIENVNYCNIKLLNKTIQMLAEQIDYLKSENKRIHELYKQKR